MPTRRCQCASPTDLREAHHPLRNPDLRQQPWRQNEVTGDLHVKSIKIDPQAVDPEDVELLQDMVLAAVNEGLRAAQELAASKLGGLAGGLGGLGLPGM